MRFILLATLSACAGPESDRCRRLRTAIGVSEPKLMTLVTISPGSKPKVDELGLLLCRVRLDNPPFSSRFSAME